MITTFYTKEELARLLFVENFAVNEIYQDVRKYNPSIYLKEDFYTYRKKWFQKPIKAYRYQLLFDHGYDVQVYNFYHPDISLCPYINTTLIINYLLGFINGYEFRNKES